MNDYEDARIQKTRAKIFTALTIILKNKPFDTVTISDICHEAHISRATFYHHYQTKEDIVNAYQQTTMKQIYQLLEHSDLNMLTYFERLTIYLDKNAALLGELLSERGTLSIQIQIRKQMANFFQKKMLNHLQISKDADDITKEYTVQFYSNAIFGVLQHWLTNNPRQSPEKMTKILSTILPASLLK
ncbi:TetR/AcrR family transcriptional regulator [Companilactobacillus huachuanensis]|uniref:TetR/AcrR family transcriptional regulator n=1 Tax=Companilactobacillus huachuanensis TaxID=2559914 RepID=A0ABW1RP26_9LACO|nr:TetR/AcrR family transcriptional regulator [Companilactobacillus huachuanensis]